MIWTRWLGIAAALPWTLDGLGGLVGPGLGLAEEPAHRRRRRKRHRRGKRCHKRRKWMGILALAVAFLAGKCCGMKKRGGCGGGGCGSCGCNCACASRSSCCCCKGSSGGCD